MENLPFLKEVLTTATPYWVAARKEYVVTHDSGVHETENSIWFIMIPDLIQIGKWADDLLVKDVEELYYQKVDNICLSERFSPFQSEINMSGFYQGFSITVPIKDFLKRAIQLESNNLEDYKKLLSTGEDIKNRN